MTGTSYEERVFNLEHKGSKMMKRDEYVSEIYRMLNLNPDRFPTFKNQLAKTPAMDLYFHLKDNLDIKPKEKL